MLLKFTLLILSYISNAFSVLLHNPFIGHPKIIHRDIKSANILLDDAYEAQARILVSLPNFFSILQLKMSFFLLRSPQILFLETLFEYRLLTLALPNHQTTLILMYRLELWGHLGKFEFFATPKLCSISDSSSSLKLRLQAYEVLCSILAMQVHGTRVCIKWKVDR